MVQEDQPKADQPSPGALLKAGREKAGLSVEQVAEKLHLLQSVVASLEKDSYERIRGDTFVRGYMRNYAKLIGIDANEVVGRFNIRTELHAKIESRFVRRREPFGGPGGAGRLSMVAALLAISAGLLAWNRAPPAAAADTASDRIIIETARGEQVVALARAEVANGR